MEMSFVSPGYFQVEFFLCFHNTIYLVLIVPDGKTQLLRENELTFLHNGGSFSEKIKEYTSDKPNIWGGGLYINNFFQSVFSVQCC
jgi:hypothetical protein